MIRYSLIILASMASLSACNTSKNTTQQQTAAVSGPAALVYKTKGDYSRYVPVQLSEDKKSIVSYPDPRDIVKGAEPTQLTKGYLLDNRGVGLNTAYLNITLTEYAAMGKAPTREEMMKKILDANPMTELYNCGNKNSFSEPEQQLNDIIQSGQLEKTCKRIK